MLSFDTQQSLLNFFLFSIENLTHIDIIKRELNANLDFDPTNVFNAVDSLDKGYINTNDINAFLTTNMIYSTEFEINILISYFDHNDDGVLSYEEFINLIYAFEMRDFSTKRNSAKGKQFLSFEVQSLLCDVFQRQIRFIRQCTELINRLKRKSDFDIQNIFSLIKQVNKNNKNDDSLLLSFINKNELDLFISNKVLGKHKNNLLYGDKESELLFNWLNVSKTGNISIKDLCVIFQIENSLRKKHTSSLSSQMDSSNNNYNRLANKYTYNNHIQNKIVSSPQSQPKTPSYTQYAIINSLFELLYTIEQNLEQYKIKLSKRNDFNVDDAFLFFEENPFSKNFLTENDLQYGLNKISIFPTHSEISLLIRRFSSMKGKFINYSDFFNMLVPYIKSYRNIVANKHGNYFESKCLFLGETIKCIRNVLEKEIVYENKIHIIRKKIASSYSIDINEFITKLDKGKKGYLNVYDIRKFYKEVLCVSNVNDVVCDLVFLRLDKGYKGRVTYEDVIYECRG